MPNTLTLIRMLLIPVYLVLFTQGKKYPALFVFLAASFTDLLDGMIARRYHLITDLGKLMDPLADKLMVLTVMFSLAIGNDSIPYGAVGGGVHRAGQGNAINAGRPADVCGRHIVVYSFMIGKVAHCLFISGLTASFFHEWFSRVCPGWFMTPDQILLWVAVACTLAALVFYWVGSLHQLREAKKTPDRPIVSCYLLMSFFSNQTPADDGGF